MTGEESWRSQEVSMHPTFLWQVDCSKLERIQYSAKILAMLEK